MLIREICLRCMQSRWGSNPGASPHWDSFWDEQGVVWCPAVSNYFLVDREPPEGCWFLVEQLVSKDDEAE